jgi:hypothetical protein
MARAHGWNGTWLRVGLPGYWSCSRTGGAPGAGSAIAKVPPATFHRPPLSPMGDPQFTVPSGQRGVGLTGAGAAFPRPALPRPAFWAKEGCNNTVKSNKAGVIARRRNRTRTPVCDLGKRNGIHAIQQAGSVKTFCNRAMESRRGRRDWATELRGRNQRPSFVRASRYLTDNATHPRRKF